MSGEALKDQFVRAVLSTLSLCRWTFLLEWVDNDRFLKKLYVIAAFIIVFIGSMWTISTYMNGIKGDAEREIFKQRLKTYELASKTVGELASLPDGAEWLKARDRFLSLYYGDLAMFESQTVTECMSQFNDLLVNFENDKQKTGFDWSKEQQRLQGEAIALARLSRQSLEHEINFSFPDFIGFLRRRSDDVKEAADKCQISPN